MKSMTRVRAFWSIHDLAKVDKVTVFSMNFLLKPQEILGSFTFMSACVMRRF